MIYVWLQEQASWGVVSADNWDQGWLHRFTTHHGRAEAVAPRQHAAARSSLLHASAKPKPSIEEVNALMHQAVGMLQDLEKDKAQQAKATGTAAPASAASSDAPASGSASLANTPGAYVPNRYDRLRNAKYAEQQQKVQDLPMCFKINKFDDMDKNEAHRRLSDATAQLSKSYPDWAKGLSIPGVGQTGEWRHDRCSLAATPHPCT